ncbi:MAG: hypothetical protein ACJZ4V_01190 [Candidatus Poseidoniaceae archaeon]|tara:strand:+ start:2272 stop:2892 length:621 start_codon:yes stop_codon:yes gene_type:complete
MAATSEWKDNASSLDDSQQELLTGGGLSKRFAKLPLWLSHPSNIGAFYGLLVSLALILPYYMTEEFWFPLWILHASLLIFATAFLGIFSRLVNALTGRMPMSVNRKVLYPMPFIGFALFTLIHTDLLINNTYTQYLAWGLLMIPGPLYIHLSWAPRWRLLCMIEDGANPFENMPVKQYINNEENEEVVTGDSEMMEVVESFESEEE